MDRTIVGFHRDDHGDWAVELSCGHTVLDDDTRNARLGTHRDCPLRDAERGGEASCYAHLVCEECGVVLDGSAHAPGCASAG
jgi:hypothetical protein